MEVARKSKNSEAKKKSCTPKLIHVHLQVHDSGEASLAAVKKCMREKSDPYFSFLQVPRGLSTYVLQAFQNQD